MPIAPTALVRAAAAVLVTAALAVPARAQEPKLKDHEKKEVQSVWLLIDQAITTQVPNGATVFTVDTSKKGPEAIVRTAEQPAATWYADHTRAVDGTAVVSFMVLFDQGLLPSTDVTFGVRVVAKGTTTLAVPPKDQKGARLYPWDDVGFGHVKAGPAGTEKKQRFARAFQVPGGAYDVYVALRPHSLDKVKDGPAKAVVFRQAVEVPDLKTEFTTSSIMALRGINELPAPLAPDQAREEPWVMGRVEFVPNLARTFPKTGNFAVFFQVYNPTVEAGKPDVTLEYKFHRRLADGTEKYFNKTSPQQLNASSLPPEWNAEAGSPVNGSIDVPLASFEPGDYRLEITVTDNKAKKAIARDVLFTITAS